MVKRIPLAQEGCSLFETLEQQLLELTKENEREFLGVTDGERGYIEDQCSALGPSLLVISDEDVLPFARQSCRDRIFVYHSHPHVMISKSSLSPPTEGDLKVHFNLRKKLGNEGYEVCSRIVDLYGIWEYDLLGEGFYPQYHERVFSIIKRGISLEKQADFVINAAGSAGVKLSFRRH